MNWIILILAGLMEVGFIFCLGKTKTVTGWELTMRWVGFLAALALSMYPMAKATEKLPIGISHHSHSLELSNLKF